MEDSTIFALFDLAALVLLVGSSLMANWMLPPGEMLPSRFGPLKRVTALAQVPTFYVGMSVFMPVFVDVGAALHWTDKHGRPFKPLDATGWLVCTAIFGVMMIIVQPFALWAFHRYLIKQNR